MFSNFAAFIVLLLDKALSMPFPRINRKKRIITVSIFEPGVDLGPPITSKMELSVTIINS